MPNISCKRCSQLFYVPNCRVEVRVFCSKECKHKHSRSVKSNFERFWSYVEIKSLQECWEWKGGRSQFGYGKFSFYLKSGKRKTVNASQFAYRFPLYKNGKRVDANGLFILHKCDNPPCCNPKHLYPGTFQDNADDAVYRKRMPIGENNGNARFTEYEIIRIREWYTNGKSKYWIARQVHTSESHITRIVNYDVWKYI